LRLQTGSDSKKQWVGLPVIAIAMTAEEAKQIDDDPMLVQHRLGQPVYQSFMDLRASVTASQSPFLTRYGSSRLDCRPFGGESVTIERLLHDIVSHLNDDPPSALRGRLIKPQNYLFDELIRWRSELSPVFTQLTPKARPGPRDRSGGSFLTLRSGTRSRPSRAVPSPVAQNQKSPQSALTASIS
jgi:hypothetical protein